MSSIRTAFLARRLTVLFLAATLLLCVNFSFAETAVCKAKGATVKADYPEFARRMKISGVVRLQLQLTASGSVRESKILGGNPVLASSAQQAVKQVKFEGNEPCIIVLEFRQ
jgi:TonB family protein